MKDIVWSPQSPFLAAWSRFCIPLGMLLLVTTSDPAQERVTAEPSITAADLSFSGFRHLSSIFMTVPGSGWISYRQSSEKDPPVIGFDEFTRIYKFSDPRGIAYAEPSLYVYEAADRTIWSIDIGGRETPGGRSTEPERRYFSELAQHPSHLAVSPHGLIAVIEKDQIVFLQKGNAPTRYGHSKFPDPIDIAFSSWDTLHVLDGKRNALVTITFTRSKDGELHFANETEPTAFAQEPGRRWRAMGLYEGLVYLADDRTVYAYLEADQSLIPVITQPPGSLPISQLALTGSSLYLLQGDRIARYPRFQPVDFALEGGPHESQRALMAIYSYLHERSLLPTVPLLAHQSYERLQGLLVENGVLLSPAPPIRVQKRWWHFGVQASAVERVPQEAARFMSLFCTFNKAFCDASRASFPDPDPLLFVPVPQGTRLEAPKVTIISRLGRNEFLLRKDLLQDRVDQLVVSPDFRRRINSEFLLRLNPAFSPEELSLPRSGMTSLPIELWTVIAAVPASDYTNRASELWHLTHLYDGLSLHGREVFQEQSAKSVPPAPAPPPDSGPCDTLKQEYTRWIDAIKYPTEWAFGAPDVRLPYARPVQVGILEYATTVQTGHQAYSWDPNAPAWHQAKDTELLAMPSPASLPSTDRSLSDVSTFSTEAHHGTHVAAMIGGRRTDCWSGLLPRSRLILVDLTDAGRVRRSILNAEDSFTTVFNVSLEFPGVQSPLQSTIEELQDDALFVVAAGNSSLDLNGLDPTEMQAPACWGHHRNVIVVAASDWNGTILPQTSTPAGIQQGSNHGKRYVDLIAPGKEIYSATETPGSYGPATGTSQAAPAVTAAAALLADHDGFRLKPGDVKARLIATADWKPQYEGSAWGGALDFARAVRFPDKNLLRTTTGNAQGRYYAVRVDGAPRLKITNAPRYYERYGAGAIAPEKLDFRQILSLKKLNPGVYRVVLREHASDQLRILLDAQFETTAKLDCSEFELYDPPTGTFKADTGCSQGISIAQIEEYTQGAPYNLKWPE